MEIIKNPSGDKMSDCLLKELIVEEVGVLFGEDKCTDKHVVDDGTHEPMFVGTLKECVVFSQYVRKYKGYEVMIWSWDKFHENN